MTFSKQCHDFFQCLDVTDGNDDVSHGRDDEGWKRRLAEHQFLETGSFLSTRELKEIVSQSLIRLKRPLFVEVFMGHREHEHIGT